MMKDNQYPKPHQVNAIRKQYLEGTRVALVKMDDPHTKLKPGDEGTVCFVDDMGTVHINWDCGSTLGAVYGEDTIRKI